MSKILRLLNRSAYFRDIFVFSGHPFETSLSLTLGFYLSLFPVPGTTTLLCVLVSLLFRLNLILLQGINWLFTPLQLFLFYPFIKAGNFLFFENRPVFPVNYQKNIFETDSIGAFRYLLESLAGGILVWGIVGLLTGFFLFRVLLKIMMKKDGAC